MFRPRAGAREQETIAALQRMVNEKGDFRHFSILDPIREAPFPHLKVMTVDGMAAYIGSANLSDAALTGRNLKFGVLVHGSQVHVVDAFLNLNSRRSQGDP